MGKIEVSGIIKDEKINVMYTETDAVPQWYLDGGADILLAHLKGKGKFGVEYQLADNSITWTPENPCPAPCAKGKTRDACTKCDKNKEGKPSGKKYGAPVTATRNKEGWAKITGEMPHYVNVEKECIIFFCAIQNKWHMCGDDGIYYRNKGEALPLNNWTAYRMKGKDTKKVSSQTITKVPKA